MIRLFLSLSILLILFSCQSYFKSSFLKEVQATDLQASSFERSTCSEKMVYAPDPAHPDHTPIKYIRINFHIMCKPDGRGNFDEKTGRPFILEVLEAANDKLSRNQKMRLPIGNSTASLPMRYRYVLTPRPGDPGDDGIYFHYDDSLYHMIAGGRDRNNYDQDVYEKYGVQKDTVLNIFVMGEHVDSVKSDTYRTRSRGVGFGSWAKVAGWHHNVQDTIWENGKAELPKGKWFCQKLLNHEIGHCLGLSHTWNLNDGCDDTPKNPNCWGEHDPPPCDSLWGNNFMDYNTHASAWSPCQIATIHYNFQNKKQTRNLLDPRWCALDATKTISIDTTINWLSSKDLEGNLILLPGAELHLYCKLSLPKAAKITIHPKAKLFLHEAEIYNDCGDKWLGIEILQKGKDKGMLITDGNSKILNTQNEIIILAAGSADQ